MPVQLKTSDLFKIMCFAITQYAGLVHMSLEKSSLHMQACFIYSSICQIMDDM